eukprot:11226505-Lingulodinium_polyedra.AAC.1
MANLPCSTLGGARCNILITGACLHQPIPPRGPRVAWEKATAKDKMRSEVALARALGGLGGPRRSRNRND